MDQGEFPKRRSVAENALLSFVNVPSKKNIRSKSNAAIVVGNVRKHETDEDLVEENQLIYDLQRGLLACHNLETFEQFIWQQLKTLPIEIDSTELNNETWSDARLELIRRYRTTEANLTGWKLLIQALRNVWTNFWQD